MFATRIVPLVFSVAVLTGGTASAQSRQMARPGFPQATPRHVPPAVFVQPKPFVAPQVVAKPFIAPFVQPKPFVNPHVVAKPIFVPPVGHHHHHGHHHHAHHHHHGHHHPVYVPPFWGGLWGSYPLFPVAPFPVYGLPSFWFGW